MLYRVVQTDNFDRENVSERFITEPIHENMAKRIQIFLNETYSGPNEQEYYKMVPENYQLYKFEP